MVIDNSQRNDSKRVPDRAQLGKCGSYLGFISFRV